MGRGDAGVQRMNDIQSPPDAGDLADDEAKVFLSYSRKDRERASGIADALRTRHFGVFKDTDDILPTEEWRARLQELIEEADTVVFLLSPHSAKSEVCAWEVEYAHSLNKRIAPIVIEDTDAADIPPLLAQLNFIFCTPRDPFENAVDTLASALSTDIEWIREHTRLAGLARRWDRAERAARFLLRGQDIVDAEMWRERRPDDAPAITTVQAAFVGESRRADNRRQRTWIGGSLAIAAGASALAVFAYFQSMEADRQRGVAEEAAAEAKRQRVVAEESAAEANRQRRIVTERLVAQSLRAGDFADAGRYLVDIAPDAPITETVLAGFISPEAAGKRDAGAVPFRLNGSFHLSREGLPPLPIEPGFSATGWLPMPDGTLLISDSSAVKWVDSDGVERGAQEAGDNARPCGAHFGRERLMLYSLAQKGLSAGSQYALVTWVPFDGGEITREERHRGHKFLIDGPAAAFEIDPIDLMKACENTYRQPASGPAYVKTWEDFERSIRPFDVISFPGLAPEATLWSGPVDPDLSNNGALPALQAIELTERELSDLGFRSSDMWRGDVVAAQSESGAAGVMRVISSGGTTQDVGRICLKTSGKFVCRSFGTLGRMRFTLDPQRGRLAIYGRKLEGAGRYYGLIMVDKSGAAWSPGPNGRSYGEAVLSADFNADGDLALLDSGALVIQDGNGNESYRGPRPRDARALAWLPDGRLMLLAPTGVLLGGDPESLAFTPFNRLASATSPDTYATDEFWIAPTDAYGVVGLGYERELVLFDTGRMAPISGTFEVPDRRVVYSRDLTALPDAGWRLNVVGNEYQRRGWKAGDAGSLFDREAPFRSPK